MTPRHVSERRYHDAQAADRAVTFASDPSRLRFKDSEYLSHAPWVRPAMNRLGDVAGKRILDLGCGHGMAAVVLARRGAIVTACDLSPGYIAEAQQRATANEAIIDFAVAAGEQLPFDDQSFNAIWGHAILHHLDIKAAAKEIHRVLRPDGVAVFCEPWDGNLFVRWLRRRRQHTKDERAISSDDIRTLAAALEVLTVDLFQFGRYAVIACAARTI